MINKISSNPILQQSVEAKKKNSSSSFSDTLKEYIQDVNNDQIAAKNQIVKYLKGETKDLHSTVISLEKAEISLQLMLQIKNKLTQAYQEVMRMPV
jgi:flagellar hook-basal body complex protein FliE